ncbi:MAG: glycosyltransferase family 4 protein [Burkholderiales bacterium]|nr:glycosyltransferase family 4 protein [Burkholderiales bacterium]
MHIGIVAPEFPPEIGGMQTLAAEFAGELAARGHRVTVLTRRRETPAPVLPGIELHQTLVGRAGPDLAECHRHRPEAWHVMNAAYAWLALHFSPTLVSIHGNDFLRPYIPVGEPALERLPLAWRSTRWRPALERGIGRWRTPRLMRSGLRRATHILANSRYTERVFLERFPECRGRTTAAMVGVGAGFLAASGARPSAAAPRLVTVCRLSEERKNVGLVLQALARLQGRFDFSYTVVGDGALRPGLEQAAQALGLAGRVRFTGTLPIEQVRAELAAGDLFVLAAGLHPGSHEGFGIVYLEANACGTPTLAARLAGAAEAVQDGVSGYFVDTLSAEGIAQALARFLGGELHFEPEACRAFARRHTWARVVDAALPWYGAGRG